MPEGRPTVWIGRGVRRWTVVLLLSGVGAACSGSNIFPDVAGSAGDIVTGDVLPPTAEIRSPLAGTAYAAGQTATVSAVVSDNVGVRSVTFRGVAVRGTVEVERFVAQQVQLSDVADTTLTYVLQPTADATAESVNLIVQAADTIGNVAADTVQVQITG